VATSLRELESLRDIARDMLRLLDQLISVEKAEQERADRIGEPTPRRRIS
jgi:hypothetical protein